MKKILLSVHYLYKELQRLRIDIISNFTQNFDAGVS